MTKKNEWEDEMPEELDDWPFDEDDEFIVDEILDKWDDIEDVDDFKYVEGD